LKGGGKKSTLGTKGGQHKASNKVVREVKGPPWRRKKNPKKRVRKDEKEGEARQNVCERTIHGYGSTTGVGMKGLGERGEKSGLGKKKPHGRWGTATRMASADRKPGGQALAKDNQVRKEKVLNMERSRKRWWGWGEVENLKNCTGKNPWRHGQSGKGKGLKGVDVTGKGQRRRRIKEESPSPPHKGGNLNRGLTKNVDYRLGRVEEKGAMGLTGQSGRDYNGVTEPPSRQRARSKFQV